MNDMVSVVTPTPIFSILTSAAGSGPPPVTPGPWPSCRQVESWLKPQFQIKTALHEIPRSLILLIAVKNTTGTISRISETGPNKCQKHPE